MPSSTSFRRDPAGWHGRAEKHQGMMQWPCQTVFIYISQLFNTERQLWRTWLVKNLTTPRAASRNRASNRDWHASCNLSGDHFGPKEMDLVS
jgi:hypothetical protein